MEAIMPPDRSSQTGVELALAAIQGTLEGYKSSVEEGFREMRQDLKEHVRDETRWQEKMETELLKLVGIPAQVDSVKKKVDEHDSAFLQAKGALLATRLLWAAVGFAVAAVGYITSHVVTIQTSKAAAPRETSAYIPTPVPQYFPAATTSATSSPSAADASLKTK